MQDFIIGEDLKLWHIIQEGQKISTTTDITNELDSLGEIVSLRRRNGRLFYILPDSWENKVDVIMEAKNMDTITMEELMRNLKTYEIRKL